MTLIPQSGNSQTVHFFAQYTHTRMQSAQHKERVWSNKAASDMSLLCRLKLAPTTLLPMRVVSPGAVDDIKGICPWRSDSITADNALAEKTAEIRGRSVLLTTCNHVYLNHLKQAHLFPICCIFTCAEQNCGGLEDTEQRLEALYLFGWESKYFKKGENKGWYHRRQHHLLVESGRSDGG